jgi:hypothetical protein
MGTWFSKSKRVAVELSGTIGTREISRGGAKLKIVNCLYQEGTMRTTTFGAVFEEVRDRGRILTQMEVIRDVLLSAAECADQIARHSYTRLWNVTQIAVDGGWLTLREIADLTNYGEASISAQLRHLRKPYFGAYVVVKRRRGSVTNGAWEYRIAGHCECAQLAWLFAGEQM